MDKIKISIAKNKKKNEDVMISDSLKNEEYFCYDCNKILIPKKGNQLRHHYAHKSLGSCNGESWKHIYSKKIISKYIKTIIFETKCECETEFEISFDNDYYKAKEEFSFNEYLIDVGIIDLENNLCGAIEVFHTHKTTNTKIKNIIYNNIYYIEIDTFEVINKVKELESGNIVKLKCIKNQQCNECSDYPVRKKIYNFTQYYSEYFGNIDTSNSIIELNNSKITELLNNNIKFIKDIDQIHLDCDDIRNNPENPKKELINKEDVIRRLNTDIIAGSFTSNIFLQTLSTIRKKPNKYDWIYSDIDIWKFNEDGLISHEKQGGIQYLLSNKYVKEINCKFDTKKIILNIIETPHAKNIKELLYSFDIACCQVAYQNGIWYITPYALFALITGINIEETTIHDIPVIIELIKPKKTKSIYTYLYNKYPNINFDHYENDDYLINPILTNIYNAQNKLIKLQNYCENLKCNYNEKELIKSSGAIWHNADKSWSIPPSVSILNFGSYIYKKTNINLTDQLDLEDANRTYLLSLKEPLEYWALICLTSDHNQIYRRLCAEIDNKNINIGDAEDLLYECKVKRSIIRDLFRFLPKDEINTKEFITLGVYQDGNDGGWGCNLENSNILSEVKNILLHNNKNVKKLLSYLRTIRRRNKYKERGFQFSTLSAISSNP
jgi:hypothetical protein